MKTHRPYELQEYNPKWKEQFLNTAERLRPILGDNLLGIEHIGSTSIEGMVAKPQIDILVIVKNLALVKERYEDFKTAGFVPRGTEYVGTDDEYVTEDAPDGRRIASIHIFQEGHQEIDECRIFRDYLRVNKEDRELYISTKRDLYALYRENYAGYDSNKKDIVNKIKVRAKKWAATLTK